MLIGEYIHSLDKKNRVPLPAKWRKEMGKKLVLTPGLDNCLFVFTEKEWERISGKLSRSQSELSFLSADQRSFNRQMFGQASEVETDSIGRILVPEFLKRKIGLGSSAAFVGVGDRVEIWSAGIWKKYVGEAEKRAGAIAEKLGNRIGNRIGNRSTGNE
jgi:MraZ protein